MRIKSLFALAPPNYDEGAWLKADARIGPAQCSLLNAQCSMKPFPFNADRVLVSEHYFIEHFSFFTAVAVDLAHSRARGVSECKQRVSGNNWIRLPETAATSPLFRSV